MKYNINISGYIGWDCTADYVKWRLGQMNGQRVDMRICSLGGYVTDAMDIYQAVKEHGDVHCHFVGMSASAATFLAMGAKEVTMEKNSLILIHNAMDGVFEYGSFNKEQLRTIIENLGKTADNLETIDELIATIYADRCGKTLDEVKEKMKVAAWISSQDAKDFGLVDEVTEKEDVSASTGSKDLKLQNYINAQALLSNDMLQSLGLPALAGKESEENTATNESVLHKVAQLLGIGKAGQSRNQTLTNATNENKTMLKIFKTVAAILALEGFALNKEGNIELTQEQLKTLEDSVAGKDAEIENLKKEVDELKKKPAESKPEDVETINDLKDKLTKAQNDLTAANEQIKNLKEAPGASTTDAPANEGPEVTGAEFAQNFI